MPMKRNDALIKLSHDHHHGLAMSHRLQKQLEASSLSDADRGSMATSIVDFYAKHLVPHFEAEEQALFPLMQQQLGDLDIIQKLLGEHRLMQTIAEECRANGAATEEGTVRRFAVTLEGHIRKEERVLFEMFDEKIPDAAAKALIEQLKTMGHI